MTQNDESKLKISSPQRVNRILKRICDASLQVMIKGSKLSAVAVKGRAACLIERDKFRAIRISNVSAQGMEFLQDRSKIQVEFVMMSTKIIFISTILSRDENSLVVRMPSFLVSIERRKNARFGTTEDLASFLALSLWIPKVNDATAPPCYPHFENDIGHYISIADVSMGGFCGITRFPQYSEVV